VLFEFCERFCVASVEFTSIVRSFEADASEPAVCSTDLICRDVRPYARFSHIWTESCVSYALLARAAAPFEFRSLSKKDAILS
jgi:hypothetical protein